MKGGSPVASSLSCLLLQLCLSFDVCYWESHALNCNASVLMLVISPERVACVNCHIDLNESGVQERASHFS